MGNIKQKINDVYIRFIVWNNWRKNTTEDIETIDKILVFLGKRRSYSFQTRLLGYYVKSSLDHLSMDFLEFGNKVSDAAESISLLATKFFVKLLNQKGDREDDDE